MKIFEYTTKGGLDIDFKVFEDTERKDPEDYYKTINKKGRSDLVSLWKIDVVAPFHNGKPIGYLKISNVPREEYEEKVADIISFAVKVNNESHDGPMSYDLDPSFENWPKETLLSIIQRKYKWIRDEEIWYYNWSESRYYFLGKPAEEHSEKVLVDFIKKDILPDYERKYGKQKKEFEAFHVDASFVDYIFVEPEYQRKGVALAMYLKAAQHMKKKGLRFYASGIQSDDAKLAWEFLEKKGYVGKDQRGRYIKI